MTDMRDPTPEEVAAEWIEVTGLYVSHTGKVVTVAMSAPMAHRILQDVIYGRVLREAIDKVDVLGKT